MRRVIGWSIGLAFAYVVIKNIPDVLRYIRISRM